MFQNRWDCISARKILGESHTFFLNASCLAFIQMVKLLKLQNSVHILGKRSRAFSFLKNLWPPKYWEPLNCKITMLFLLRWSGKCFMGVHTCVWMYYETMRYSQELNLLTQGYLQRNVLSRGCCIGLPLKVSLQSLILKFKKI